MLNLVCYSLINNFVAQALHIFYKISALTFVATKKDNKWIN
ncbi:hypothetical protein HMPREF0518_0059 [Lactobacillus helveticus DSM 20075 = CGMCC 1.1877]|nr:hypothetical protein HMPREF0518_0059 [Lactobacillus helveticus DSM 20075 = CGMCC 1.1877]